MNELKVFALIVGMILYVLVDDAKAELPPPHQLDVWINAACSATSDQVGKQNCALLVQARELIDQGDNAGAEELIAEARNNTLGRPSADTEVPLTTRQQHEKSLGNPQWRRY